MVKNIIIKLATGELESTEQFSGEHNATTITFDYTGCNVDSWAKWVIFKLPNDTVVEPISLGTNIIETYTLPQEFLVETGTLQVYAYAIDGVSGARAGFAMKRLLISASLPSTGAGITYDPTQMEQLEASISSALTQINTIWLAYNNGELDGADGVDGADGADGASITSVAFVGNDMVFTKDDASTVTLVGAKLSLKGDTGATGLTGASIISAAFVGNDLVFTKSDTTTVTLVGAKLALKGDTGATGATGLTGATGATPNITVGTVTTGAPGSSVIVTKTGTAANPVLNFTIPKGDTGATGGQGLPGQDGVDGEDGKNFTILGQYASLAALQSAHPTGVAGDVWAVGTASESDLYIWDTVTNGWKDIGQVGINLDASSVTLEDLAGNYTATDVEAAFAELITKLGTKAIKPTNESGAVANTLLASNGDGTSTFKALGTIVAGYNEKTIPIDADKMLLADSTESHTSKKVTWANIKATLKTYFETLFPTMTTGDVTYYVSPTGSNSNNGLTSGTAFQTITYALSKIPKNIRHTVNINVASGTYNEIVDIQGFYGNGILQILGGTAIATAVNYKVDSFTIIGCLNYIFIRGFEGTSSASHSCYINNCRQVNVEFFTNTQTALTFNGIYSQYSHIQVHYCLISNKNYALYADHSFVFMYLWQSGSGNNYGIRANNGSVIFRNGTMPQGTTPEYANAGIISGSVINPAPQVSPAFTGTPTAPTATAGTNTTQIATTAFVKALGDTKANTSHTHATSDVTGLDTALAGKASSTHSHNIGDVINLTDTLNGKADTLHSHTINGKTLTGNIGINLEETIIVSLSDETTAITAGAAKATFRMPYACKLTTRLPRASVNTASSSGVINVDINKNGASILTNRVSIDASEKTSLTAATAVSLATTPTTFSDDDEITFDIDNAGTGAKGLKVTLFVERI